MNVSLPLHISPNGSYISSWEGIFFTFLRRIFIAMEDLKVIFVVSIRNDNLTEENRCSRLQNSNQCLNNQVKLFPLLLFICFVN